MATHFRMSLKCIAEKVTLKELSSLTTKVI